MRSCKDICTAEELIEALEACHGITGSAVQYLREKYHIAVGREYISSRIKAWGMEDFLKECRVKGIERGLTKMLSKALDDGNEKALMWMLEKYGHHCDFLSAKESNGMDINKGDIVGYYEHLRSDYARKDPKAVEEAN